MKALQKHRLTPLRMKKIRDEDLDEEVKLVAVCPSGALPVGAIVYDLTKDEPLSLSSSSHYKKKKVKKKLN